MPDAALYILRAGDNEELRFSLRSLEAHFPEMPVFVVGDKPEWLTNVDFTKGNRAHVKQMNVWQNLLIGTSLKSVPEDLLIMNDDFYFTGTPNFSPLYRCTLEEHWEHVQFRRDWWSRSIDNTRTYLDRLGFDEPLSYEVHTPFLVGKSAMRAVLEHLPRDNDDPPQWRTVYGNVVGLGGEKHKDVKVYNGTELKTLPRPLASSTDESFHRLLPMLAERYPYPSRFETQYES